MKKIIIYLCFVTVFCLGLSQVGYAKDVKVKFFGSFSINGVPVPHHKIYIGKLDTKCVKTNPKGGYYSCEATTLYITKLAETYTDMNGLFELGAVVSSSSEFEPDLTKISIGNEYKFFIGAECPYAEIGNPYPISIPFGSETLTWKKHAPYLIEAHFQPKINPEDNIIITGLVKDDEGGKHSDLLVRFAYYNIYEDKIRWINDTPVHPDSNGSFGYWAYAKVPYGPNDNYNYPFDFGDGSDILVFVSKKDKLYYKYSEWIPINSEKNMIYKINVWKKY